MSQTRAQLVKGFSNTEASADAITIDSSGNVAIGGDPNAFSNYTTLTIGGSGTSTGSGIDLERSDGNIYGRVFADANGLQIAVNQSGDDIRFETAGGAEKCRILAAGGLTFNGETDAAHALDDYEEGTHVPVLTANSGTLGTVGYHGDRGARYVRIGTMVWYWGTMRFTSFSAGTGSGTLNISLPVAAAARVTGDDGDNVGPVSTQVWNGTAAVRPTVMKIRHNTSTAFFQRHGYDVDNSNCDVSDYNSTFMAAFSICYRAA